MSEEIISENDNGDTEPVTLELFDFGHTLVIKRGTRKVLRLDASNATLLGAAIAAKTKCMAK